MRSAIVVKSVFCFLIISLVLSRSLFGQNEKSQDEPGLFYKKSVIPREVIVLPFLGFGYTGYNIRNENKMIENLSEYLDGSDIPELSPGPALRGGIGFFLPYANTKIMLEYQKDRLTNERSGFWGMGTAYSLIHEMKVYLFQVDKLFPYNTRSNSSFSPYTGFGAGIILISDTRTSRLDYKYSGGAVKDVSSELKTETYLGVVNLLVGQYNTKTGSVFFELRAGYQYSFNTSIKGKVKPGFDPSDYSSNLNAFRFSLLFGIVI